MNPGSTFERSSRTRALARARLVGVGGVGLLALLAATRAHADWSPGPALPAPPTSVLDVWGVGTYAVGYDDSVSRAGACLIVNRNVARDLSSRASVGTFYNPVQDCFVSMSSDGRRATQGADGRACGGINLATSISTPNGNETFARVKHAREGGSAAVVHSNNDQYHVVAMSDRNLNDPLLSSFLEVAHIDEAALRPAPYSVARMNGEAYYFIGQESRAVPPKGWWGSSPAQTSYPWSGTDVSAGQIVAVEFFAAQGPRVPLLVVGTRGAVLQGSPDIQAGRPLSVVERLASEEELFGLSMTVGDGNEVGEGFGMALVRQANGELRVLSPVPAGAQAEAGTVWRPRKLFANAGVEMKDVRQVACYGAATCVLTAPGKAVRNHFVYSNTAGPGLAVTAGSGVQVTGTRVEFEEGVSAPLRLGAVDPDGDPVRVIATPSDVPPVRWSVGPATPIPGEAVEVPVTVARVCEDTLVGHFGVRASDGLKANDLNTVVDVYVKHKRPEAPRVELPGGAEVPPGSGFAGALDAGGAALTLTAVGAASTDGCAWTSHVWTKNAPGGPRLEENGGTATLFPPATFCEAAGRDFEFTLTSTDVGKADTSRTLKVHQRPWGAPERVFGANAPALEVAPNASVTLMPEPAEHACRGAPAYPGVVTSWSVALPDGSVPGNDYVIQTASGGPQVHSFPVEAPELMLRAAACQPARELTVSATHRLKASAGAPTPSGPESQRQVRFAKGWTGLAGNSLKVEPVTKPGTAPGTLSLNPSGLDCVPQRRLRAELKLTPEKPGDSGDEWSGALPDVWRPQVACGSYKLEAVLEDASGQRQAQSPLPVVLPGAGVRLEPNPEAEVKAVCGQGASVALAELVRPAPGFCATPEYSWVQGGKTRFEPRAAADGTVTLASENQELDALIGQWVEGKVEASKGDASASQPVAVRVTTEPFVRVERHTELPAAAETGLVGVLVRLTNTTGCDVSEVVYQERLEALSFVAGSARLDGVSVEAGSREDALQVTLPRLEAGATHTLSYVARPHLLGERRMQGEASKNTVTISMGEPSEMPREGCGCTSAGAAPGLLGLALLKLLEGPRRRRAPRGPRA